MIELKGISLRSDIGYIKKIFGEEGFQKAVNTLSEEDRKVIASGFINANAWIPVEPYVNFLEAVIKELAGGNNSVILRMSEATTQADLTGIYRMFLKIASPDFLIKRAPLIFSTYCRNGEIKVDSIHPGLALITIKGFAKHHRVFELQILGFCKAALKLAGAQKLSVKVTKSLAEAEGHFEITASWS